MLWLRTASCWSFESCKVPSICKSCQLWLRLQMTLRVGYVEPDQPSNQSGSFQTNCVWQWANAEIPKVSRVESTSWPSVSTSRSVTWLLFPAIPHSMAADNSDGESKVCSHPIWARQPDCPVLPCGEGRDDAFSFLLSIRPWVAEIYFMLRFLSQRGLLMHHPPARVSVCTEWCA